MPFPRNERRGFRRSRSRSPYQKRPPHRRSRSPRPGSKYGGHFESRDSGRRPNAPRPSFRDRGRSLSPHRRSPRRSPRKSPRRSPVNKPRENKSLLSFSIDEFRGHPKDFQGGRRSERSRSHSPQRASAAHMDRIYAEPKLEDRLVKTKSTLTERFGVDQKKFTLEDNITIGLQRNPNLPISTVVNVNTKNFDFEKFSLKRRIDEGSTPIFDREEIKAFHHDDNLDDQDEFERRVITIQPSEGSRKRDPYHDVDLSVRKSLSGSLNDDRHWNKSSRDPGPSSRRDDSSSLRGERFQITRMRTPSPRREPQVRLDPKPDPRYEAKYRANREREERQVHRKMDRIESFPKNPNDLRHSLLNRRISSPSDDARYKIEFKRKEQGSEKRGQGRDAWDVAMERQRDRSHSGHRQRHQSDESRNLPDFKNRDDKYQYEEWVDKPEMVPKGVGYFEHDNRGEDSSFVRRGRARGRPYYPRSRPNLRFQSNRGGYRPRPYSHDNFSRGRGSGSYRSRGGSSYNKTIYRSTSSRGRSSSERGEWKHDMYDKLEKSKDDDNCPTSTT